MQVKTKRITEAQVVDAVETLMNNLPEDVDMQIVESAIIQVMRHNEITFKPYNLLLAELMLTGHEKVLEAHESVQAYFFDGINSIQTRSHIEFLISETIVF